MAEIIREDVIRVSFDIIDDGLKELLKGVNDLKRELTQGVGDDAFDELKKSASDTVKPLNEVKEAANDVSKSVSNINDDSLNDIKKGANDAVKPLDKVKDVANDVGKEVDGISGNGLDNIKEKANRSINPLRKVKERLKEVNQKLTDIGKKGATLAFNGLKKVAGISFKALALGIGAAATAMGALVKNSVEAYAEYEQLVGGVDTLFKGDSKTVQKNANNAFKTAGLSANKYMETVTSFSASLINSVGGDTAKAAKLSDMAITDMADNANKLGTSMDSVIETYQSLARGNWAMLDNLKLGYGGTKEEMKRLVNDAAKLDKSVKANDLSYANLVKAIHAVQKKMGVTGTTAKEAEHTITGSAAAMKSAWGNMLTALIQGGDNFDQCLDNLISSAKTFGKNLKPALVKALSGIGTLVEELAPIIEKELPTLVDDLLPPLIKAATSLLKALIKSLPSIAKTIIKELPDIFKGVGEALTEAFGMEFTAFNKIGDFFEKNGSKIEKFTPIILGLVGALLLFNKIKSVGSFFTGLFGGKGGKGEGGLFSDLTALADIKPTVILKGMGNLAIVLGGFTILSAALMAVAPYMAKLSDFKSIIEVVSVISILGLVGTGLAKLAGIVGNIPVSTVAKGLANMAIIIAGMSALFLLIGAVSLIDFDLKKIMQITTIIGVLGIFGSALTVFAGIAGLIPIPVVLAGLANMALVLGGVSAIIIAFGALSQIKGFNEFISKGGDLLANLFKQIGKIAGSIISGIGEGISNSLPKIGENLSAFAKSLKPMFSLFKGVDMTGVGEFFSAIGSFMLKLAGGKILEFFGGSPDFSGIAKGLGTLAKSEGVKNFFTMVNGIEEGAFTKGKMFFECLDGISSLPNVGGFAQLFSGKNDFTGVANGLGKLACEGVKNFFTMVSGLDDKAFDNSKKFFTSLDGISALPNVDGLGQLFTGKNDFEGVAKGLTVLSGEGVKNFFTMVKGLDESVFEKTSLLFKSLADIGEVGKEGFFEKLGNLMSGGKKNETSGLSAVAKGLGDFASKTSEFFAQVNSLNLNNLNGLWKSLEKAGKLTTENLSSVIDESISDLVSRISKLPQKMGDALKENSKGLSDGFVEMWKDAVKASVAPVNKLLSGANHILKEFGSKKRVIEWTPYARGTDGHKGGNALVNDGNGAELVQMPNGNSFIPQGRNVLLPNAPKGMKVLTANQTAQLMGKTAPTFKYANGIGDIDIWSYYDNAKGLVDKITEGISYDGMSSLASSMGKGMVTTFSGEMPAWIDKMFEECGQSLSSYVASKGVTQWLPTVVRALKMEGQYSLSNVARTLFQMRTESGGNPKAINLWDSNAKKGIPSKGLMQVIDPTFKAYARAGFNKNIYDPLSNILASIRYAVSRYGSLAKAYRGVGYANGGVATTPSIFGEDGAEMAIPLGRDKRKRALSLWAQTGDMLGLSAFTPENSGDEYVSNSTEYNTYSPQFTININGTNDDRTMARKVKRWISESLEEFVDEVDRSSPKLREV